RFEERLQHKTYVRRPFRQAAHEIAVPIVPEWNVYPHLISFICEIVLRLGANAVEHLKFKLASRDLTLFDEVLDMLNDGIIMGGNSGIVTIAEMLLDDPDEIAVNVCLIRVGDVRRFLVGALHEPQIRPEPV